MAEPLARDDRVLRMTRAVSIVTREGKEFAEKELGRSEAIGMAMAAERDHLLRYYSRERLMSPEARFGWVEPDLQPLG